MGFQARDPRNLVHYSSRIPRQTRQTIRELGQKQQLPETEIHRRALEIGLKALASEPSTA